MARKATITWPEHLKGQHVEIVNSPAENMYNVILEDGRSLVIHADNLTFDYYNYFEAELQGIKTTGEYDAVKVKFQTMYSATKWLTLTPSDFEAVEALLIERYALRDKD